MTAKIKKLYRNPKNKVLAGIFGGLEDYLNVDATVLRLVFLLLVLITGIFPGVIVYFIAALIVPRKS